MNLFLSHEASVKFRRLTCLNSATEKNFDILVANPDPVGKGQIPIKTSADFLIALRPKLARVVK